MLEISIGWVHKFYASHILDMNHKIKICFYKLIIYWFQDLIQILKKIKAKKHLC